MHILMIYDNSIEILVNNDSRVLKEIETLTNAGHEITVIAITDYITESFSFKIANKSVQIYGMNHNLKETFSSKSWIRQMLFDVLTSEATSNMLTINL